MPARVSQDLPREINLAPTYPGYFLIRRRTVGYIRPADEDECRERFLVEYDVRRELSGRRARSRFNQRPVRPTPKKDKNGRWQLELRLHARGKLRRTPYHRLVALSVLPCHTDNLGREIEPYWINLGGLTRGLWDGFWEVDHDDGNPRNNMHWNLYVYRWKYHRSLQRH